MTKCSKCGTELIVGQNWYKCYAFGVKRRFFCSKCSSKKSKNYRLQHLEDIRKKDKLRKNGEYRRNPKLRNYIKNYHIHNRLKIHGKQILVRKRKLTGLCEICDVNILESNHSWHHWNDKHPEHGLWLCTKCHRLAEAIEYDLKGDLRTKYLQRKEEISHG